MRLLARSVPLHQWLLHVVALTMAGSLTAFVAGYVLRIQVDRAIFFAGASYSSRIASPSPDPEADLSARVVPGAIAAPVNGMASGGSEYADLGWSGRELTLLEFPVGQVEALRQMLSSNLIVGELSDSGVVVDQSTLVSWGIGIGDQAALPLWGESAESGECLVRVTGMTRPYHGGFDEAEGKGLLLLPQGTCPEAVKAAVELQGSRWENYQLAGGAGVSSTDDAVSVLTEHPEVSGGLIGIVTLSFVIWILAIARTTRQLAADTGSTAVAIVRQGWAPSRARWSLWGMVLVVSVIGVVGGNFLAQRIMLGVVAMYAQPLLRVVVGSTMMTAAVLVALLALRGWPVSSIGRTKRKAGIQ